MSERIWIGTWSLGGERYGRCPEPEAIETLSLAYELGYRRYDTAGFYAHGQSERRLQKALGSVRNDIYLSSKGGLHWDGNHVVFDASPAALTRTLNESLERLQTNYLDLFSLHWPDPNTPLHTSIETLQLFQKKGLIKQWGVGNLSPIEVESLPQENYPIAHQVHYNPIIQDMTPSMIAGQKKCMNVITSPFEHGLLLDPDKHLGKKDHRRKSPLVTDPIYQKKAEDYFTHHQTPDDRAKIILTDLLNDPLCDALIVGPRHPQQLDKLHQIVTSNHLLSDTENTTRKFQ